MSQKPIERLNYFNGQRLEADDLRLEQEYHIQIQRWLMKTLFRPGVARGFDVHVLPDRKKIVLDPGLALDDLGRAIILVGPVELTPQARLLCIRYSERKERQQDCSCAVRVNGGATLPASWGGPERILSQPDIFWRADPPARDTRELIIAELELDAKCTVKKVTAGPRLHASPLPVQQVRQLSFEGEKDIDANNPKVINFYIRGGRPNAVTLYLRAKQFSTLHYSEMGQVTPVIQANEPDGTIKTGPAGDVDVHSHGGSTLTITPAPHAHDVMSNVFAPGTSGAAKGIFIAGGGNTDPLPTGPVQPPMVIRGVTATPQSLTQLDPGNLQFSVTSDSHQHVVSGNTAKTPTDKAPLHKHPIDVQISTAGSAGATTVRNGNQLTYLSNLEITVSKLGGASVRCTEKIRDYVKGRSTDWIGQMSINGSSGDPLYTVGTGPIRLDLIDGLSFEPDDVRPYEIKLWVEGRGNGGCIEYNLYVE